MRLMSDAFSSRGSLTTKLIGQLYIIVPKQNVVLEFDEIAEPMIKQIGNLTIKNSYLRSKRDLLLSRLISGKLTVDDLDIQFPPSMMEAEERVHA